MKTAKDLLEKYKPLLCAIKVSTIIIFAILLSIANIACIGYSLSNIKMSSPLVTETLICVLIDYSLNVINGFASICIDLTYTKIGDKKLLHPNSCKSSTKKILDLGHWLYSFIVWICLQYIAFTNRVWVDSLPTVLKFPIYYTIAFHYLLLLITITINAVMLSKINRRATV